MLNQTFKEKTSIEAKALYDVEAAKSTGNVNRFLAEKNHPHCDGFWGPPGKQFVDYLLSTAVEKHLAFSPTAQIPVRPNVARPPNMPSIDAIKTMAVSYEAIADLSTILMICRLGVIPMIIDPKRGLLKLNGRKSIFIWCHLLA